MLTWSLNINNHSFESLGHTLLRADYGPTLTQRKDPLRPCGPSLRPPPPYAMSTQTLRRSQRVCVDIALRERRTIICPLVYRVDGEGRVSNTVNKSYIPDLIKMLLWWNSGIIKMWWSRHIVAETSCSRRWLMYNNVWRFSPTVIQFSSGLSR